MADISTFEGLKDYILLALVGFASWLVGQIRRADLRILEERLARLENDIREMRGRLEDHLP